MRDPHHHTEDGADAPHRARHQASAVVESLEGLQRALDISPLAMVVTEDDRIVYANQAFAAFIGHDGAGELVGASLDRYRIDGPKPGRRNVANGQECRFRHRSGAAAWGRVTTTACTVDRRDVEFVQVEDVTHARARTAELAAAFERDPLTGLVERASFLDAAASRLAEYPSSAVCLLVADVDRIGSVNAMLGHGLGDRLLEILAGRLHFATRADDLLCRLGGDQFAVLLGPPAGEEQAVATAERLLSSLRDPIDLDGNRVAPSVSIGISTSATGATVASLLADADVALRHAKAAGRDRFVVFDGELRTAVANRSRIEGELAMALDGERLELYYQPEVDLHSGGVLGVEALARWDHPTMGMLGADAFVTVAEDVGLVAKLGRWALRTSCASLAAWTGRHPALTMRVNVSAAQLANEALVADVRRAVAETGIDPSRLCLEITETAVMTDVDASMHVLAELAGLGVQLAIDDFGTGFSSLAYLRRLPVEILKIDRSFVADVVEPDGRAIVSAILQLAASLGLEVIAEGIEDDDQHEALRTLGCRRGQGHKFAPAMPGADVLTWLDQHRS